MGEKPDGDPRLERAMTFLDTHFPERYSDEELLQYYSDDNRSPIPLGPAAVIPTREELAEAEQPD